MLRAQIAHVIARAEGLMSVATRSEMRDALALVALGAHDARVWLLEVSPDDGETLNLIESKVASELRRLQDLDQRLRESPDAWP